MLSQVSSSSQDAPPSYDIFEGTNPPPSYMAVFPTITAQPSAGQAFSPRETPPTGRLGPLTVNRQPNECHGKETCRDIFRYYPNNARDRANHCDWHLNWIAPISATAASLAIGFGTGVSTGATLVGYTVIPCGLPASLIALRAFQYLRVSTLHDSRDVLAQHGIATTVNMENPCGPVLVPTSSY